MDGIERPCKCGIDHEISLAEKQREAAAQLRQRRGIQLAVGAGMKESLAASRVLRVLVRVHLLVPGFDSARIPPGGVYMRHHEHDCSRPVVQCMCDVTVD